MTTRVEWNEKFWPEMRERQHQIVLALVHEYERVLLEMFRLPKHGRIYRVGKTPTKSQRARGATFREHQASAPGEAPAILNGRLWRSVGHVVSREGDDTVAQVGTSLQDVYPLALEFGTKDGKIKPRPAWIPALDVIRSRFVEIALRAVGR